MRKNERGYCKAGRVVCWTMVGLVVSVRVSR